MHHISVLRSDEGEQRRKAKMAGREKDGENERQVSADTERRRQMRIGKTQPGEATFS